MPQPWPSSAKKPKKQPKKLALTHFLSPGSVNGCLHGQNIGICAEPGNLPETNRRNQRPLPEFFPGMDIRKMNLYRRNPNCADSVAESDACVRIGGSIENERVEFAFGLLNPRDQLPFEVGLPEVNLRPQLCPPFA